MYEDIGTLIYSIYGIIQAVRCWFGEYITTMTLKVGFKQCNTYPCVLYRLNSLGTEIGILYVDDTLEIRDKLVLMDMIEFIKKSCLTQSMSELEELIGCKIKRDLTKITLNISQLRITTKMTQVFNEDLKSLMNFNNPDTYHNGIVYNQETDTKIS